VKIFHPKHLEKTKLASGTLGRVIVARRELKMRKSSGSFRLLPVLSRANVPRQLVWQPGNRQHVLY